MREYTRYATLVSLISNPTPNECISWPYCPDAQGYGRIWFNGKTERAARVVFFITHGRWPEPLSRHTCDTNDCINPKHVIEGTYADNVADTIRRGRLKPVRGEQQRNSKLTKEAVLEIRNDVDHSHQFLANKFGVSRRYIGRVKEGLTWKHVSGTPNKSSSR